jgi:hypothetical protein
VFRRCNQKLRVINLIDEFGAQISTVQEDWVEITSHESVLAALKNCANCFSCRGNLWGVDDSLVTWALDKTVTVDTFLFL